jgi:hypothetical protein
LRRWNGSIFAEPAARAPGGSRADDDVFRRANDHCGWQFFDAELDDQQRKLTHYRQWRWATAECRSGKRERFSRGYYHVYGHGDWRKQSNGHAAGDDHGDCSPDAGSGTNADVYGFTGSDRQRKFVDTELDHNECYFPDDR